MDERNLETVAVRKETMTSLEIAELSGKQHQHVMRDIRALLEQGVDASNFGLTSYTDKSNRQSPMYRLTKKGCLILASGYDALLREKIINRWEELEKKERAGGFIVPKTFSQALMLAAQQQEEIERQQKLIEAKDRKIAEDAPKVVFSDAVVGSKSSCLIGELAKILTQNGYQIGQNRLFEKLRHDGYLGTKGEYYNIPNQKYVEQGLFEIKKTTHSENGVMKSSVTPKVTGKGQQYFINKYLRGIQTLEFKNE